MAERSTQVTADADVARIPPDHASRSAGRVGALSLPRRMVGAGLIALTILPVWRLLDPERTGLAGAATVTQMTDLVDLAWSGALLALIPLVLLVWLGDRLPLDAWLARGARRVASMPTRSFALLVFALSAALALAFELVVLEGKPNLIDAMAQLAHARIITAGALAGPSELAEFHFVTNSVLTDAGWVSQYPPGHPLLLALGMTLRAEWLVGPLALGAALAFSALIAERALPHARVAARSLLLLACASPFLLAHAGSYMSHTTAAALVAAAVWCILRARDGDARWALLAGLAGSAALAVRPLSALAMVGAAALAAWLPAPSRVAVRRFALALAGALPITLLHLWYNAHFFGAPLRLGYVAAYGPAHGLGFGADPWGNAYGPIQAAAYTSADLTALAVALFEIPLPLVALAGAFLLLARTLRPGERVIAAWAIAPVAANALYWHHGNFMGPRMLNEAAPAWVLLVAVALAALLARAPQRLPAVAGGVARPLRAPLTAALVVVAIAVLVLMVPTRLASWGGDYYRSRRIAAPEAAAPALVFVHGPWMGRVGARLAAAGMRSDSIETALRQNTTCAVEQYADAREREVPLPRIDLEPRADRALPRVDISPENYIRHVPGEALTAGCVAQIQADRLGVLELAPFLWQGVPAGAQGGALFVRDMGPERNRRLLERESARRPLVFAAASADAPATLHPYEQGMRLLWGGTTPSTVSP